MRRRATGAGRRCRSSASPACSSPPGWSSSRWPCSSRPPRPRASSSASSRCCSWSASSAARSTSHRWSCRPPPAATGVLAHVWFERAALPGQYVGLLAFAHVLAVAYAVVAFVRDRLGVDDDAPWVLRADHGRARRGRRRLRRPARRPGAVRLRRADAAVRAARSRHRAGAARRDPPRLDVPRAAGGARRLPLRRCVARAPLHARHRHGRGRRGDRDLPAVRGAAVRPDRGAARRVAPGRRRLADLGADRAGVVPAVPRRLARLLGPAARSASSR